VRRAFEQSRLPYASSAWATASAALDAYAASWKRGWTEACDATHRQGIQTPAILQQRTLCLAERKRALEALTRVLGRGEPVVIERAVDAAGALPDLRGCADVGALAARPALPERPELRARVEQVRQQLADAFALKEAGKAAEGLPLGLAAVAEAERTGFRPLEAEAQLLLAQLQEENGDYRGAEQSYGKAGLRAEASRDAKIVLQAQTDLVLLLGDRLARHEAARAAAERAAAVLEGVGGDPLAEAQLESHLGVLSYGEGDYEQATAHHRRAVSLREQGLGPDAPLVAVALNLASTALIKLARYTEAQEALERALRIAESALGRDHPLSTEVVSNLGTLFLEQGRYAEGLVYTRRTLESWEKSLAPDHPDLAIALTNHGRALRGTGDHAQARQAYQRAVQIREATLGPEHPLLATPLNNLGVLCDIQGEDQAALDYYERALAIRRKALGPTHASVAETLVNLGGFHQQRGRYAQAISLYEEALRIDEKALGPDHPFLADEYDGMGECQLRLGKLAEAIALLERSLVLREKRADHVETADAKWLLAQALVASGRDRERARLLAEQAREASAGAGTDEGRKLEAQVRAWIAGTFGR
jgi:serine/threonine-protein kinase